MSAPHATTAGTAAVTDATAPRPRGLARRAALLQATLELVGERGADAVTHRAVAQRAELPLASTTYWFASKDELITEALRHAADRDVSRLRDAAAGAEATAAGIVTVLLDPSSGAERGTLLATYTLMLEAARRPALQAISEAWTAGYLETVGALLHRAGSTRPADDARLLVAAADGLTLDRLASGGPDGGPEADPAPELIRLVEALLP